MSSFGAPYTPPDADPGWQTLAGEMRVRVVVGLVQIQISEDLGDGTFNVSTINLTGHLRDTRHLTTQWPDYNSQGLPVGVVTTDTQRLQRQVARADAQGKVTVPGTPITQAGGTGK